ncbi:hypothetical protein FUAX_27940 [Fulvitalea axinellae]|uniref:4Fe4S-binding SPASM domain-containing protein n=2 Tax=Fulvitalea axinellae TaxID=1182444 RepID=A0AAU9CQX0_9BACT|nr:hypothetical protein FUAX_27940 [Fulvitalea axinellae]
MDLEQALQTPFCPMPWLHLHVSYHGRAQACCNAVIPFGNINDNSLTEILDGESIRNFRKKMLALQPDNRCSTCYRREETGQESDRTETLRKFAEKLPEIFDKTQPDGSTDIKPAYLDIRFSNLCNLRCRTCWHGYSSSWYDEAKQLKRTASDSAVIHNIENTELFISQLEKTGIVPEEIFFAGGEPLISEGHSLLINWLLEKCFTKTRLRYNTNLSTLEFRKKSFIPLWKQFKNVSIGASLDASGTRGEYIRKGLDWDRALRNREVLKRELPLADFFIAPTVSVLNMAQLPAFHLDWFERGLIGINDIKLNTLERPFHFNIKSLRPKDKVRCAKIWRQHIEKIRTIEGINDSTLQSFEACINFMEKENLDRYATKFDQETKKLDEMRNERFSDLPD